MEIISRKISLEPYITRYPVCYPSLDDGLMSYLKPNSLQAMSSANYGKMPLGINEESIEMSYSAFTQEMHDAYHGIVLSYQVLQRWFKEMLDYKRMLYSNSCHGRFDSMENYYGGNVIIDNNITARDMDERFKLHGGDNFYNWLIDNYFVLLDLENAYYEKPEISEIYKTYGEWVDVMTHLGTSQLTYPYALSLLAKMSEWYSLYSGSTCSEEENCCDCVDYWSMGGNIMYHLLSDWVDEINANIDKNNTIISGLSEDIRSKLYSESDISFVLKEKMEDFGVLDVFANNFNKYKTYTSGEVCVFGADVWINDVDKTIPGVPDDGWDVEGAPGSGWTRYSQYYYSLPEHSGETIDIRSVPDMSGRTKSSLESFEREEETIDGLGNTMPGYFRPYSGSTVTQPPENCLLELMYKPGSFVNSSTIIDANAVSGKTFFGDVIESISFICKNPDGDVMSAFTSTSDDVMEQLSACTRFASEKNTYRSQEDYHPTDGKIYSDFTYYKGCVFNISSGGSVEISGETYLKCVDHCSIEESTCQYHLSQTESYPLRYYKVIKDTNDAIDEGTGERVSKCDFYFKPSAFSACSDTINVVAPTFRKEECLNFSRHENAVDNIYIDRGYATALDKHLRMGEIRSFEQLEKYGNGIFEIFNADEGII